MTAQRGRPPGPTARRLSAEDPNWQHVTGLDDLPDQLVEEVAHFFLAYKHREGHEVDINGWSSHEDAEEGIRQAQARFRENHPHDETAPLF